MGQRASGFRDWQFAGAGSLPESLRVEVGSHREKCLLDFRRVVRRVGDIPALLGIAAKVILPAETVQAVLLVLAAQFLFLPSRSS